MDGDRPTNLTDRMVALEKRNVSKKTVLPRVRCQSRKEFGKHGRARRSPPSLHRLNLKLALLIALRSVT